MARKEVADDSELMSQINQSHEVGKQDTESCQSNVDGLEEKLADVTLYLKNFGDGDEKELEVLRQRVKSTATMLNSLSSEAKLMAGSLLAEGSYGIEQLDGLDNELDSHSSWKCSFLVDQDAAYIDDVRRSVLMVANVIEGLVKRVILAESDTAVEKEKVTLSEEEIKNKSIQIENMYLKLEEMQKFTQTTVDSLRLMHQRIEDLVDETSRQRRRAVENEEELSRVKQDFESLKSFVRSLVSVRETLISQDQCQSFEELFERLSEKSTQLEGEKKQKEAEVQRLMVENMRLTDLLDKKEAQLLAMNEQCKLMALNSSDR